MRVAGAGAGVADGDAHQLRALAAGHRRRRDGNPHRHCSCRGRCALLPGRVGAQTGRPSPHLRAQDRDQRDRGRQRARSVQGLRLPWQAHRAAEQQSVGPHGHCPCGRHRRCSNPRYACTDQAGRLQAEPGGVAAGRNGHPEGDAHADADGCRCDGGRELAPFRRFADGAAGSLCDRPDDAVDPGAWPLGR